MNRKLLNGLLVASLAIGSAMSVTSCKDTDEDLYAQLRDENATLDQRVKADIEALKTAQKALEDAQKKCQQDCDAKWKECLLKKDFEKTLNDYVKLQGQHATLKWYLDQIDGALVLKDADGNPYETIGQQFLALESAIAALQNATDLTELQEFLKENNTTLPDVLQSAINAEQQANENEAILKALLEGYEYSEQDVTKIKGLLKQAVDDAAAAKATADEAKSKATTAAATANTAKDAADKATAAVATLTPRVETVEKEIEKITAQLDAMTGKLNHLITGIVLQQVKNPVFGKINLPLDINSKMLVAYFGEASNVNFPPVNTSRYEYDNTNTGIDEATASLLNIDTKNFNGYLYAEYDKDQGKDDENKEMKLGSVYMTVNPAGVVLDGAQFDLVNSKDELSPVHLTKLVSSNDELMFGVGGRSEALGNGFYVTDAMLPINKINDVKLTLGGNFESEVEDLLKNHTLSDLAQVAKLIYGQFNNKISATGVKAGWEYEQAILDEEGKPTGETETINDATYSEYGLAATTFKPLSYKFLYGRHFKPLPTISPIEDFTLDSKLTITMPEFNFNFDDVNLGFSFGNITVDIPDGTVIEVKIPKTNVYKVVDGVQTSDIIGVIEEQTVKATDFTSLENALSTAISNALKTQDQKINDAFKKAIGEVAKKINSQINTEMAKLKTNIETQFNNIVTEIQNKVNGYLGTVNNYIDKANSFLNRINRFIEDPNHYLQVTMLYSGNDGAFHQVSNSSVAPTTLVLNGGDGITLHPTSYTYDMIAPSFKKYVAVTKVYKNGEPENVDLERTKAANNTAGLLNTIFPGNYTDVALKLEKNYTYEIVYSSLDYHGVTSTRKFYIAAE